MRKSKLRNVVRNLCSKANMKGFHTKHPLRATTCLLALGKGVQEKLIMDRTGHRDVIMKSLHVYQRDGSSEREAVSDVLQGSKKSFLKGSPPKNVTQTDGQEEKFTSNNFTLVVSKSNVRNLNKLYSIY